MPECEGCHHHPGGGCLTLSAHSYSLLDENVKAAQLAEQIADDMQRPFDAHKDATFESICDEYGRPENNHGKAAHIYPENDNLPSLRAQYSVLTALSAGAFSTEEPAVLSAGLVVLDQTPPTDMSKQKKDIRRERATARDAGAFFVHDDNVMRDDPYAKPVLDMSVKNATYNSNNFATDAPTIERIDNDAFNNEFAAYINGDAPHENIADVFTMAPQHARGELEVRAQQQDARITELER
eukprot:gene21934-26414_t